MFQFELDCHILMNIEFIVRFNEPTIQQFTVSKVIGLATGALYFNVLCKNLFL